MIEWTRKRRREKLKKRDWKKWKERYKVWERVRRYWEREWKKRPKRERKGEGEKVGERERGHKVEDLKSRNKGKDFHKREFEQQKDLHFYFVLLWRQFACTMTYFSRNKSVRAQAKNFWDPLKTLVFGIHGYVVKKVLLLLKSHNFFGKERGKVFLSSSFWSLSRTDLNHNFNLRTISVLLYSFFSAGNKTRM